MKQNGYNRQKVTKLGANKTYKIQWSNLEGRWLRIEENGSFTAK